MPGPVFKTGEGFGNRLLVGSIPIRSRHASSLANHGKNRAAAGQRADDVGLGRSGQTGTTGMPGNSRGTRYDFDVELAVISI